MVSILGANSVSGGYEVENSLRFNDGDSPRLTITPSSAGNRRTFTLSVWLKLTVSPSGDSNFERQILAADDGTGGNNNFDYISINNSDKIFIYNYEGGEAYVFTSTQILRDPSAWYHLVVAFDTTQGTNTNRVKIYLNGSQITAFDTASYPSQNHQTRFNNNNAHRIGSYPDHDSQYFDGYMCEYHLVDGSQLTPTSFGEFDDNGVWVPIEYTGSHGTNGFYLEFKQTGTSANSSGIGADTSGNDHHWAVTNFTASENPVTEDTCTNNFATLNPLFRSNFDNDGTFSVGNLNRKFTSANSDRGYGFASFGVTSGKWYWEIKIPTVARANTGIGDVNAIAGFSGVMYDENPSKGFMVNYNGQIEENATATSYANSLSDNDIVMWALDMDNHRAYYGINGTWQDSGDPTSGSTGTGDVTTQISDQSHLNTGEPMFPFCFDASTSGQSQFQWNFGNPIHSISSGNTDGKYGNFEYAPPSGYYALCTKRLAEFG